jgi:hypothetical protein
MHTSSAYGAHKEDSSLPSFPSLPFVMKAERRKKARERGVRDNIKMGEATHRQKVDMIHRSALKCFPD